MNANDAATILGHSSLKSSASVQWTCRKREVKWHDCPLAVAHLRARLLLRATIVTGLDQRHELVQQECFGPVVTVQRFSGDDEGLTLANGVESDSPDRYGRATSARHPICQRTSFRNGMD